LYKFDVPKEDKAFIGDALRRARINYAKPKKLPANTAAEMIANHLDGRTISRESLAKYESNTVATPLSVAIAAEKAYNLAQNTLTSVYHLEDDGKRQHNSGRSNNAEVLRTVVRRELTRVMVRVLIDGRFIWSAKGLTPMTRYIDSTVADGSDFILIDDEIGHLRKGMVIVFLPSNGLAREEVFHVFQKRADRDVELLGYIPHDDPGTIIVAGEPSVRAIDYDAVSWAYAAAYGLGEDLDDISIRRRGIGPRTRV
jgi:hypothetical protein